MNAQTMTNTLDAPSTIAPARVWHVDQKHPHASDDNDGAAKRPFASINRAAQCAWPGDTVLVHDGVYRERVNPQRGGEPGRPIVFEAATRHRVFLRGSDILQAEWVPEEGYPAVYRARIPSGLLGTIAYKGHVDAEVMGDCNPFRRNFNRAKIVRPMKQVKGEVEPGDASSGLEGVLKKAGYESKDVLPTTLGQLFVEGKPFTEANKRQEVHEIPGTWIVDTDGESILAHFPCVRKRPEDMLVEISTRHTVFSPLERGLSHIHVRGFVIEHGANHFPTWGKAPRAWDQVGLLSTRAGSHWLIEDNIVRYAKGIGIDIGANASGACMERPGRPIRHEDVVGIEVRNNLICDNGLCGLTGLGHHGTRVLGNVIERNNRTGYTSPWWEFGGIKFHFFFDGLIEGNLIRDNDCHGIWIDNQWRGSRITRNVLVNNMWSGINVEMGRGPALIDNNVITCTRQGDGVYGHDVSEVTIAHNLIYANANFGVWLAYCTKRVKNEDGCWDNAILNNMILGNRAGAVSLPLPFECAGNNVSNGNLFMGGGAYLDEGSGPMRPLFQVSNNTHCGQFAEHSGSEDAQTPERVLEIFQAKLKGSEIPEEEWPNPGWWKEHYFVSLHLWREALGHDENSAEMTCTRDGFQSHTMTWSFTFDETIRKVRCEPVQGVTRDFRAGPFPHRQPLPGPFQNLDSGRNQIAVWPVMGVPTPWVPA